MSDRIAGLNGHYSRDSRREEIHNHWGFALKDLLVKLLCRLDLVNGIGYGGCVDGPERSRSEGRNDSGHETGHCDYLEGYLMIIKRGLLEL